MKLTTLKSLLQVAKPILYKIILAHVAYYDLVIHQMDVKSVFLNGKLDEEIYMESPNGLKEEEDLIYCFLKSLYGLKQSL